MTQGKDPGKSVSIPVEVTLLDLGKEPGPKVTVYAFSSGGQLLNSVALDKNQQTVTLKVPLGREPDRVRVLVGPGAEEADLPSIRVSELLRRGAQERLIRVGTDLDIRPLPFPVPPVDWRCWIRSLCFVPGTLHKRQDVDGVKVSFPVCNATVEVFEVDPFPRIIDRLPLEQLAAIRERLRRPGLTPPIPLPEPLPGPLPQPGPRPPLEPFSGEADPAPQLPEAVAGRLQVARGRELRDILVNHPTLVRPVLCRHFPWLVTSRKVAEATTDECGRFTASFFRGCFNTDKPDLYFKAKRPFFGLFEIPLLAPTPVACHTHWNYECGTEVNLFTDHPLAQTCQPCEPVNAQGHWVLVTAIGNLPLSRIRGASSALSGTTNAANLGLNHSLGDAPGFDGRPFGGLLRLRMSFSSSLRNELGVRYYRVSFRRQGEPDSAFVPLDRETHRHFAFEQDGDLVVEGFSLGPHVVNGNSALFEIPPALPPRGQWTIADAVEDTTNAKFPSLEHAPGADDGKYELMVELFDTDGNRVDINHVGGQSIRYFVPETQDLSIPTTIETVSAHGPEVDRVQPVNGQDAFVLPLHIDNNATTATLSDAQLGGSGANECGVLTYEQRSDTLSIPFTALHPNGFASYGFTLKRGVTPLPAMTDNGQAQPPGHFQQSAPVQDVLPEDCQIGGFSSHLRVTAWATDGWNRLGGLDSTDHAGFALAPEED
ncbi:MAG: hypothetical protein R3296_08760 [Oleiphilaceae bacterium]|nr:hypothetical protein [Oleiphilaceae bacterium]